MSAPYGFCGEDPATVRASFRTATKSLAMLRAMILIAVTLLATAVHGAVYCPRVVSEHNADVTDLSRFRNFPPWKDKQGQELAIAVWQYLCDAETGLYHMAPITDGSDPWSEYSLVRDPVKLMNVYNVGFCGIFGPVLDGVFQGVGFEKGRAIGVPRWNHTTTEVWCDGGWRYFDLDVRGALRKPDGTIASVAEAQRNRNLWVNPTRPIEPFFPKDPNKAKVFDIYRRSRIEYLYRWFQAGHVMDFRLRQGEVFTRWWRPQGKRWHHLPKFNTGFVRGLLEREPEGYKSNHPEFSVWTQGNGLWKYAPKLTADSSDFADGVRSAENLRPASQGLALVKRGRGEAVFEVFTPWIIVPAVNDLDKAGDDTEAAVITLDVAAPLTLEVSLDHGHTWDKATELATGVHVVDLTRWVKGTYGYLIRLAATGDAGDLVARTMDIQTWVQVAPTSLPRLKSGANHCRYKIGDRYGKATAASFITPNCSNPSDLQKYVVEVPAGYNVTRKTARIRGDITLELQAPEGMMIDWFTAGACFTTHQQKGAKNTDNRIAYAVGSPTDFKEIYKADVPTWVNHWRYQWDEDVLLDKPVERAFVRYTGRPGVNVLRATLHLRPADEPKTAMEITHGYRVAGELIEKTVRMQRPGDYAIGVDGKPENVFIRMSVPSKRR